MYVKVRATPCAKKESIMEISPKHFAISVKEPARNNLANRRIVEIIAQCFNVSTGAVRVISGHRSPNKILSVRED